MACGVASMAQTRTEYAYGLKSVQSGNQATVTFKVTGPATGYRIILTSTSSQPTVEISGEAIAAAGEVSKTFDTSGLIGDYTWSVEVSSAAIENSVRYIDKPDNRTSAFRGGVVCITDPESDAYGYTVIGAAQGNGFMVFDPTGKQVTTGTEEQVRDGFYHWGWDAHNASPYRGGQLDGKAVFSDYKDANSGYFVIDPLNPTTPVVNLLAVEGYNRSSSGKYVGSTYYDAGIWYKDDLCTGGNATCAAFYKDAEGTHLITFSEDLGDKLVRFTLDENGMISTAADKEYTAATNLISSRGCDIVPAKNGFFVSNINDNGNSAGQPAFFYCDYEGNVLFKSSSLTTLTSSFSAIALNTAEDMLAVIGDHDNYSGPCVVFYTITWNGNTPELTEHNVFDNFPTSSVEFTRPNNYVEPWASMRFDPAGNLWAYYDHYGYIAYGLQNDAPKATTPAKASYFISGTTVINTRAMAYELNMQKVDGKFVFTYDLTGNAKSVTLKFYDPKTDETKTYKLGSQTAGSQLYEINPGDFKGGNYLWSIEVEAYPTDTYAQVTSYKFTAANGGVIPVTDSESAFFGYTMVAIGANGEYKLYDPKFALSSSGNPDCFSTETAGSPWRGTFFNGKAYVANDDATTAGIYSNELSGLGTATNIGGGRTSCVAFQGSGEDTKLYTFDCVNNNIVRYDIGEETSITGEPTTLSVDRMRNADVDIITTENGFFASQPRAKDYQNSWAPAFIYCNNAGEILYNAGDHADIIPSCDSGIALNSQGDRLAVCRFADPVIDVFQVDWSETGVPSFSKLSEIACPNTAWSHLRFDAAGNLHAYHGGFGYYVYTIAYPAAVTTTNYRLAVIEQGSVSGADDLEVAPDDEQPARIFNLQGVEMHGELAPGIYIRRTATKSEKFIVR